MTLRFRIATTAALAVAVALAAFSLIAYRGTRAELLEEVDASLVTRAKIITELPSQATGSFGRGEGRRGAFNPLLTDPFGRSASGFDALYFQLVTRAGAALVPQSQGFALPVDEVDLRIAAGDARSTIRSIELDDGTVRLITTPLRNGGALQLARSLDEVDATLRGLSRTLLLTGLFGAVVAAGLGVLVARSALRPVAQLTEAAEHVADTKELGSHIEVGRNDELGRLAGSFNAMLDALENSRAQQHRLVRDASHELRTPLTALRTNIEVLSKQAEIDPVERRELLADVTFEVEQLSGLVSELVDLATESDVDEPLTRVDLATVATETAQRFSRRSGLTIETDVVESVVEGKRTQLERALANLIDNAIKWSPPDGSIEIEVRPGRVSVRDHGVGVDPDDAPRIFDRFYRSAQARTMPGSGLGLAIVRQIIENHGGEVFVDHPSGGGAQVGFQLPVV